MRHRILVGVVILDAKCLVLPWWAYPARGLRDFEGRLVAVMGADKAGLVLEERDGGGSSIPVGGGISAAIAWIVMQATISSVVYNEKKRRADDDANQGNDSKRARRANGARRDNAVAQGTLLTRGSYVMVEFPDNDTTECAVWGVEEVLKHLRSNKPMPDINTSQSPSLTLSLVNHLESQREGAVSEGALDGCPIVLKVYQDRDDEFDTLATELEAYQRLAHLRPNVASCEAVVGPLNSTWMALVLQHGGPNVASRGGFTEISWSLLTDLYRTLEKIHRIGIMHASRNVVIAPSGQLCFIDFDRATLNHVGVCCRELVRFCRLIEGDEEDSDDEDGDTEVLSDGDNKDEEDRDDDKDGDTEVLSDGDDEDGDTEALSDSTD
ncbi:hypothetical protein B0H17DRAFT_1202931 [Mycena rosella]|uniref:Protein kinase domain-containing protein n=1 Tax=Mycena rosella TaxID=1033263 RepID=A0AAD7DCI7_MYCRO|nr:hypothetical protein B0H17DRAFT_1202931 [Mycena rosella]